MGIIDVLAIITFFILLFAAVYMLVCFYVCDRQTCKAFNDAAEVASKGSKEYVITLLNEMYNDGIWPIPYIGAAILTPLSLWFLEVPITVRTFAILFFVSFVVIYFMLVFFGHHYINFISAYAVEYIQMNCPGTIDTNNLADPTSSLLDNVASDESVCEKGGASTIEFLSEGLGVTFVTPVNIF